MKDIYGFIHDNVCFFHGSVELIEVHLAFVLDIKEFEHFLKESSLIDVI